MEKIMFLCKHKDCGGKTVHEVIASDLDGINFDFAKIRCLRGHYRDNGFIVKFPKGQPEKAERTELSNDNFAITITC